MDKSEQELLAQARDCTNLAEVLERELAKLRVDDSKSRRAAFKRALQARWNAKKIESLNKKIHRRQIALHTMLLADTKYAIAHSLSSQP